MRNLIFILLFSLLWSCTSEEIGIKMPFEGDGTQIDIYLIKADKVEKFNPLEVNKNDLEEVPWLAHEEIEFYDWSSHCFFIKAEKSKSKGGNYFVLAADKVPVFTGFFYSMLMSYMPPFPTILVEDGLFYPKDVICLSAFGIEPTESDLTLFRLEMENSGLLKEGIDVELMELKRVNETTLAYSYKVSNLDTEKVYVLDPNKMGTSRFHYFTNGPSLRKDDKSYHAHDFQTIASDKIEYDWYTKLAPGKSLTRTVTMDGYTSLPTGRVKAYFSFPGSNKLDVGEWKVWDGRIWIGNYRTEKELNIN